MQASSPQMLEHMSHILTFDTTRGKAESRIFIDMANTDLEKALKRNCTRVSVNIIFPWHLKEFDAIEIYNAFRGDVEVNLQDVYLLERLFVRVERGDATIKAYVDRSIEVESRTGKVEADVKAQKTVVITTRHDLDLRVTSGSPDLNVRAVSTKSSAKAVLVRKPPRESASRLL